MRRERAVAALIVSRAGAAAAEFALLLPLLCTMMFGTLQVGFMMYAYNNMTSVARDVTREMAVCTITDLATARNQALAKLTVETPWVPETGPEGWIVTPATTGSDVEMTIQVNPASAGIIAYLPFNVGLLTTHVQMAQEPLAFGAGSC